MVATISFGQVGYLLVGQAALQWGYSFLHMRRNPAGEEIKLLLFFPSLPDMNWALKVAHSVYKHNNKKLLFQVDATGHLIVDCAVVAYLS